MQYVCCILFDFWSVQYTFFFVHSFHSILRHFHLYYLIGGILKLLLWNIVVFICSEEPKKTPELTLHPLLWLSLSDGHVSVLSMTAIIFSLKISGSFDLNRCWWMQPDNTNIIFRYLAIALDDDDVRCVMQEMLAFIKATKWIISCRYEPSAACIAYACVYTFQYLWIVREIDFRVDNERNMANCFLPF